MVGLAIAILSLRYQTPSRSNESGVFVNVIQATVHEAQKAFPSLRMDRRVTTVVDAGECLEGVDDSAALEFLDQAWELSIKEPGNFGSDQAKIVNLIGAINPTRGQELIPLIADKDSRSSAERSFPAAMAFRHPELAASLFDSRNDQALVGDVLRLCEIRVEMGIAFLKLCRNRDIENTVINVARYLPTRDSAKFLAEFEISKFQPTSDFWLVTHPNPTGRDLEVGANGMPALRDQVTLRLQALSAYRRTDPRRAALLADSLCDLATSGGPKPFYVMGNWKVKEDWENLLVPGIAMADTPKVRAYLAQVVPKENYQHMMVVGAWSNIDMKIATQLADQALSKGLGKFHGCFGISIADGYDTYLANLAKINPKEAAKRLFSLGSLTNVIPGVRDFERDLVASRIVRSIWKDHPKQAREFCAQFPPSEELFGRNPSSAVDCLELDQKARSDPHHSQSLLVRLAAECPAGTYHLDLSPIQTVTAVVGQVALTDVESAINLSSTLKISAERAKALAAASRSTPEIASPRRARLLQAALAFAQTEKDVDERTFALIEVARAAKVAWQRLQPWPPVNE